MRGRINPFALVVIAVTLIATALILFEYYGRKATAGPEEQEPGIPLNTSMILQREPRMEAALANTALRPAEESVAPSPVLKLATDQDIELIARVIWGEAEGVESRAEQAAVAWCILNRVDYYGRGIEKIVLAPHQFYVRRSGTVPNDFLDLAADVACRWEREHAGETDVGRTLPADYLYFSGDGRRNHFTIEWRGESYWDWSLPDPYAAV